VLASAATVVPSQATASSPQMCSHGSRPGDSAEHSRVNSDRSGVSPTRRRTPVSAVTAGARHPAAASGPSSPAVTLPSTRAYGSPLNRHSPSTKYTPSRAGSARSRISHASPSPTASSTRPGATAQVSTPIPARDRTRPRGDSHPHDVAP
jgi:hypothetical protein